MTEPFVKIADGHQLFIRDWGQDSASSDAPVLFLAGWGMDSTLWGATMTALNARGLRTIAYDRRGHGRSSDPGRIDFDLLADDLAAVIETLDLDEVTVVAHSSGAGEVLRYISRHGSSRIARIIMVGAQGPCLVAGPDNPHGAPRTVMEDLLARLAADLPGWLDANAEPFAPGAHSRTIDWLVAMILNGSRRMLLDFQRTIVETDFRPEAAATRLPVTVIHGDLDVSAPLDTTGRRYAALIPGAELVVYEGVAHGVMVTHADRLAQDIARAVTESHAEAEAALA
jgi:non-heme chloroperoxidase